MERSLEEAQRPREKPTAQHVVDALPVSRLTHAQAQHEVKCLICQEEYECGESVTTLPCKHLCHPDCLGRYDYFVD